MFLLNKSVVLMNKTFKTFKQKEKVLSVLLVLFIKEQNIKEPYVWG